MKKILICMSILMIMFMFSSASAAEPLVVNDAWVRSAPPNAKALGAFMKIMNVTDKPIALTEASSSLFGKVELHKSEMHDGMMKMIPQKQMDVPAGGTLTLKPGSYHLMLMNPKSVPQAGEFVDLELRFDSGLTLHIKALVRAAKGGSMMKGHQY